MVIVIVIAYSPPHPLWGNPTNPTPNAPLRKASICCLTALVLGFKQKSIENIYNDFMMKKTPTTR